MQLNNIIFPAPISFYEYNQEKNLIWIPKNSDSNYDALEKNSNQKEEKKDNTNINSRNLKGHNFIESKYIPCLYLPYREGSDKILLFFHGNAEDIGWSINFLNQLQSNLRVNILAMEYPGYSVYVGAPDANLILDDANTLYTYLQEEIGIIEDNIILFGRSIGSGPATFLASKYNPGALILMSPYTSIKAVVKEVAGSFGKALVAERFRNVEEIKNVRSPILFIHGVADNLIPKEHSLELLGNCLDTVSHIHLSETMTHNEFDIDNDVLIPINTFFKNCEIIAIPGQIYKFPSEISKRPKSLVGKKNKRSFFSKLYDRFTS